MSPNELSQAQGLGPSIFNGGHCGRRVNVLDERSAHFDSPKITAVTGLKNRRKRAPDTLILMDPLTLLVGGAGFEPATPAV